MRTRFKYKCRDCGEPSFHTMSEFMSRFRPRCPACGSSFLDAVTEVARSRWAAKDGERMDRRRQGYGSKGIVQ